VARGGVRRLLLIALALLAILAVAAVLAVPPIASMAIRSAIEDASGTAIAGRLEPGAVHAGWRGPVGVEGLVIRDLAGDEVARVTATINRGALGLGLDWLRGGALDLGTVSVTGSAVLRRGDDGALTIARALESPSAASAPPAPIVTPQPPVAPAPAAPAPDILARLRGTLDVSGVRIDVRDGDRVVAGLRDLAVAGPVDLTQPIDLKLTARPMTTPEPIELRVRAERLLDQAGQLDLAHSTIIATLAGSVADAEVDAAIAALVPTSAPARATTPAPAGRTLIAAGVQLKDGRLTLAEGTPLTLAGAVPPSALAPLLAGQDRAFTLDAGARLSLRAESVDLPVLAAGPLDWRGASLRAELGVDRLTGRFTLPDDDAWHAFALNTTPLALTLDPSSGILTLRGAAGATVDERVAGTVQLDVTVGDALDSNGGIALSTPGLLDVLLLVRDLKTDAPWFDVIERLAAAPVRAALGRSASLEVRAALPPPELRAAGVELLASARLDSPRTSAQLETAVSSSGVMAHGQGLSVQTTAMDAVLRALEALPEPLGSSLSLDRASVSVRAPAFSVPIAGGRSPDLARATAELTAELRDLDGDLGPVVAGDHAAGGSLPVDVQLLRLSTTLRPGEPAAIRLVGTGAASGAPIQLSGQVNIASPGALMDSHAPPAGAALLHRAGVSGELRAQGLPTAALAVVDPAIAQHLRAAFGDRFALNVETSGWRAAGARAGQTSGEGSTGMLTLQLEGPSGRLRGSADLTLAGAIGVATRGSGFQLLLHDPASVLSGLGVDLADARIEPPLVVYALDTDLTLGSDQPEIHSARVEVQAPSLQMTLRAAGGAPGVGGGHTAQLRLEKAELAAALSADGWADVTMTMASGALDGRPVSVEGTLGVQNLLARALDPKGVLGSDVPLATRGRWTIAGLPASALRLVDPELVPLLESVTPQGVRIELAAADEPGAGAGLELRVANAPNAGSSASAAPLVRTRVGVGTAALLAGPTTVELPVTPALLERTLAYAGVPASEQPRLDTPFTLRAQASRVSVPNAALTQDAPPDPLALLNGVQATIATVPADLTLRLPASVSSSMSSSVSSSLSSSGPAGQGTLPLERVGVRGLTVEARGPAGPQDPGQASVSLSFFDPGNASASLGTLSAVSSVRDLSSVRVSGRSLMLGEIAVALGLGDQIGLALGSGPSSIELAGGSAGAGQPIAFTLGLQSPRLRVNGELAHDPSRDAITLAKPIALDWRVDHRWIERTLLSGPERASGATLPGDLPVAGRIDALELVRGSDAAAPGAWSLRAASGWLATDPITLRVPGRAPASLGGVRLEVSPLALQAGHQQALPALAIALRTGVGVPGDTLTGTPVSATGTYHLQSPGTLTLRATGELPTLALDVLARTGASLEALLGDRAAIDLSLADLRTDFTAGTLAAEVRSPTAQLRLSGVARDGALQIQSTQSGPESNEVRLSTISPAASRVLFQPLFPFFSSIEKRADQRATLLSVRSLSYPIDGDLAGLSADLVVDLGEISFSTPPLVGKLLRATGNRAQGTLGTKLQPINLSIREGVASYSAMPVPIGEFTLHISGRINLVRSEVEDMMIYVPIGALVSQFSRDFERLPFAGQIGSAAFRLRGPFDALQIQPVLDPTVLLSAPGARDPGRDLLRDLIGGGIVPEKDNERAPIDPIGDLLRDLTRDLKKDRTKDKDKDKDNEKDKDAE
jgi:hypothetical protein